MLCVICGKNGILKHQLVLCTRCITNNNGLICKTDAIKTYALCSKDLLTVPFAYINKNGPKDSMMYLINDIENKAVEKYGSPIKALQEIKKRKMLKEQKYKRKRDLINERRTQLLKCLKDVELEKINLDDYVYKEYIYGDKEINVQELATKIKENEFFSKYTNYRTIFNKLKSYIKENINNFTTEELINIAREEALKQYVLNNINDHRILESTVPKSLLHKALQYSVKFYTNPYYELDFDVIFNSFKNHEF